MAQVELTLVGLSEDGSRLVLVSGAGEEYTFPVDAKLRAAVRGEHARLGQLEIQMDSALRPRDIQARIRAGESPETVAAAAQTTVDKIMVFATPVLAERAHTAERAQRSSVRRKAGEGPARLLGDAVAERLRARNVDPDIVEWDAWRREDGRWKLVADYLSGESNRRAEFVYDAEGRYVVADDDEARWLVGEQSSRKGPQPRGGGTGQRRLSAVSDEEELPLGDDAIDMVSGSTGAEAGADAGADAGAEVGADEHTVDLSDEAAALREGRAETGAEDAPIAAAGDADWIATPGGERTDVPEDAAPGDDEKAAEGERPAKKPAKKTRGRASVPSWDEIMFGGGNKSE